MQKELRALGYAPGRANGYLHRQTITAVGQFCRDQDIWQACKFGPAKSVAIKAVAAKLAEVRS